MFFGRYSLELVNGYVIKFHTVTKQLQIILHCRTEPDGSHHVNPYHKERLLKFYIRCLVISKRMTKALQEPRCSKLLLLKIKMDDSFKIYHGLSSEKY